MLPGRQVIGDEGWGEDSDLITRRQTVQIHEALDTDLQDYMICCG